MADLNRTFESKAEVIRLCKANPNIELRLDAGEGWVSVWMSNRRGQEPKRQYMLNPAGVQVFGM